MNNDITYILTFKNVDRSKIISSLSDFCINAEHNDFDPALITGDSMVRFCLPREEATEWYYDEYEHSRTMSDRIIIGHIQLWVKEDQNILRLEFWPCTSSAGKACTESSGLRESFIRLLKHNNGTDLQMDHSDGTIETIYSNQ